MKNDIPKLLYLYFALALTYPQTVQAETLKFSPDAPFVMHLFAAILLYGHIFGGGIGLITGVLASLTKKGGQTHRNSGKVFFLSMSVCYVIGACVAPFLNEGQRPNFVAAILALYLLLSGVYTAKRKDFKAGIAEKAGLFVALFITAMGLLFMYMGYQSDSGTVDGSPPQAFVLFVVAGAIAAIGEAKVLIIGTLSRTERITRHMWRMCFSFFIASGSLFFGQPQLFPSWFNDSLIPVLLGFYPLVVMIYWLIKTKLSERRTKLKYS